MPRRHPAASFARLTLAALILALVLSSLAVPATAQPSAGAFGDVIDVRVVNLEVVVEKDGERVRGLQPEDFVIFVDGEEREIEYFTEVTGGIAVAPVDAAATVPAIRPGEPISTSYLIFIDEFFSTVRDRDRVLERIRDQLPNLQVGDRMAIVAFDGKRLEMLQNWTSSQNELERALQKAEIRDAYGLRRLSERRIFERGQADLFAFGRGRPGGFAGNLDIEEEQYAALISTQIENAVSAASSALRSFANPPGRKVMLLLSGGWPNDPAQYVVADLTRSVRASDTLRGRDLLDQLTETANRLGYTIYAADVPTFSAEVIDVSDGTLAASELRRQRSFRREIEEESALRTISARTGGQALLDSAALSVLEAAANDTRSYYWLGFTPDWQGNDRGHDVRVEVRAPDVKVRAREGYADLSRSTEVSMMVESTLRFGNPVGTDALAVEIGRGERSGWGKRVVPLAVDVPLDALVFLPAEGGLVADLELRVAVIDDGGNTSDVPVIPLQLRVPETPPQGQTSTYETQLQMRKQRHELVVSLYDKASGQILTSRVDVPRL
ncbi:MAG: VWA domain-containing protein [Acidobacteriota bacterium]